MAALTIPSLILKNREKETVVRLKKAYNTFSRAFELAKLEYGNIEDWDWGENNSLQGGINVMNKIVPFLNTIKRCDGTPGCYTKGVNYKHYSGSNWDIVDNFPYSKAKLEDGTSFFIWTNGLNCNTSDHTCGALNVDVNGSKPPNTCGKDVFEFSITSNGIIPKGADYTKEDFESGCLQNGIGCTGWVLLKENMDYLKEN